MTNICNKGINYPGVNATANNSLVEGLPGISEWSYLIFANSTYNYSWNPILPNNSGPHQVCPTVTTQYVVSVSDLGPANPQSDTVTVVVVPPTTTQADFSICNTANPVSLIGNL